MKTFQIIALSALAVVLLTSTAGPSFERHCPSYYARHPITFPFPCLLRTAGSCSALGLVYFLSVEVSFEWLLTLWPMLRRGTGMCRPWYQPEQRLRCILKCHQGQCHKDPPSVMQRPADRAVQATVRNTQRGVRACCSSDTEHIAVDVCVSVRACVVLITCCAVCLYDIVV